MNVLSMEARRRPARSAETSGLLVCDCGSTWFELCTIDTDGAKNYGAVCLAEDGRVTGYAGTPHCLQCGREKLP